MKKNKRHQFMFFSALICFLLFSVTVNLFFCFHRSLEARLVGVGLLAAGLLGTLFYYVVFKKNIYMPSYVQELEMARRVQQGLLSVETPKVSGIKIVKKCIPAHMIGGDFYTFINRDVQEFIQKKQSPGILKYIDGRENYLGIVVGDVAGHGVSSALVMALASGLISEIGKSKHSCAKALETANQDLLKYLENSQISHVTAFYAILKLESHRLIYSKAGHPPAILQHRNNECELLSAKGVFLGIYEQEVYEEKGIALLPKDRLFLYTDGLIEARNDQNEFFGTDQLVKVIQTTRKESLETALDMIFQAVNAFSNQTPPSDDQTLVIVEIG